MTNAKQPTKATKATPDPAPETIGAIPGPDQALTGVPDDHHTPAEHADNAIEQRTRELAAAGWSAGEIAAWRAEALAKLAKD